MGEFESLKREIHRLRKKLDEVLNMNPGETSPTKGFLIKELDVWEEGNKDAFEIRIQIGSEDDIYTMQSIIRSMINHHFSRESTLGVDYNFADNEVTYYPNFDYPIGKEFSMICESDPFGEMTIDLVE